MTLVNDGMSRPPSEFGSALSAGCRSEAGARLPTVDARRVRARTYLRVTASRWKRSRSPCRPCRQAPIPALHLGKDINAVPALQLTTHGHAVERVIAVDARSIGHDVFRIDRLIASGFDDTGCQPKRVGREVGCTAGKRD